jgi:hypothetical protein
MSWNIFASRHGTCEVDGVGVLLKREIQKEQIKAQAQKLQDTHDIV